MVEPELQDVPEWMKSGLLHLQHLDYAEALNCFRQALMLNPNLPEGWHNYGSVLEKLGCYGAAIAANSNAQKLYATPTLRLAPPEPEPTDAIAAALALQSSSADYWLGRGHTLCDQGIYDQAIISYDKALSLRPDDPQAWFGRGNMAAALGDFETAIASYDKATEIELDDYQSWNNRGYSLHRLGQYDGAIASYDKAIYCKADCYPAWNNRGYALYHLGQHEAAIVEFDQALVLNPSYPEAWHNRANALKALGRLEAAIVDYDKALALKPEFEEARENRAIVLQTLEADEKAQLDEEIEIVDTDLETLLNQGQNQLDCGNYSAGLGIFQAATSLDSQSANAWYGQGVTFAELGQHESAIDSFDKVLELKSDYAPAWYVRGVALNELSQHESAIDSLDKALKLKPDYAPAWHIRGIVLDELGQHDEAITSFDMALALKPDNHTAWNSRGAILCNDLARYEDAVTSFDMALALKPDFYEAWRNRGIVLSKLGQYEKAIASYDTALELNRDSHEVWNSRGAVLCDYLKCYEEAITSFDEALRLTQNQYWHAWHNRSTAVLYSQNYQSALANLQDGIEALKPTHPEYLNGCGHLHYFKGKIQYTEGSKQLNPFPDWLSAEDSYDKALAILNIEDFPKQHLTILQELLTLRSQLLSPQKRLTLLQDATAKLRKVLQNPALSLGQKLTLERQFEGFNQLQVDALAQQDPIQALELAEASKNRCLGRLRDRWAYQSPPYAQIQTLLSPRTAAIYWHLSPAALTTFILIHNQPPQILESKPAPTELNTPPQETAYPAAAYQLRELETWLKTWKQDYSTARDLTPQAQATSPWRERMEWMLYARLRTILQTPRICLDYLQDIDQLILIPHRDLHLIPLHALFPERYTVTYLPSAQLGLELQQHPTPSLKRLLSIEDPATQWVKAKGSTNGMLYAQLESALVTQLYGKAITQSVPRETATKLRVTAALKLMSGCLHFTGHSYHNQEDPAQSALALAGEDLLTLKDLWQLDLHQYNLVCLSSCETGITSTQAITDEYIGLVSGFLCAGAAHVISTLWPVDEISSALLMIEFHRNLLKEALPPAQALAQAQQWLRKLTYDQLSHWYQSRADALATMGSQDRTVRDLQAMLRDFATIAHNEPEQYTAPYKHPFYWAGFTITGKVPGECESC